MTQNTDLQNPGENSGLSPAATKQVLSSLVAGLEDLGDALTYLLPLFRSLAHGDARYETEDLRLELSGGDADLVSFVYDCWTNPDSNTEEGLDLLKVLFRSISFREKAELRQKLEGRDKHTVPVTWQFRDPLAEQLAVSKGDSNLVELAIHKAQHAQMFFYKAKGILERESQKQEEA